MDLSGVHECRDGGGHAPKKLEIGELHASYASNLWNEAESGVKSCTLQTQKTEMNIPHEKSDPAFLAGTVARFPMNGSANKAAMDLSFRANGNDGSKTIFEDADYFSRNYLYKLMPITFEAVNETIIHIEHNYCNFVTSGDENPNKTIHGEAEERNYKKRKSKSASGEGLPGSDYDRDESESSADLREGFAVNAKLDEDYSMPMQPLDLSLSVFHEQKTDKMLKENQSNIPKTKPDSRATSDLKQFDVCESNKENVTSSSRKIEVTISRPGQKEYYQPGEVFLNDLARISPDLIKNDCYEIDIIDRTGQDIHTEKCRTYYIVSESTWQTFENSTERIILTNDLNLGEPIRNNEKSEKPTYIIFDQYSLTESLAKICEKKGGRFEYTCLEESPPRAQEVRRELQDCGSEFAISRVTLEEESWKGCEESKSDTGKRHLTEMNILKRLLMCEKRNAEAEPPVSAIAPEVENKPEEEERLETEEKVCDNSGSASTEADAEGEKQISVKTEPVVPIESKRDDDEMVPEFDGRDGSVEATKTEVKSESVDDLKCNEDEEKIEESRKREAIESVGIGKRSKKNEESIPADGRRKRRKSEDGKDVNVEVKRVTRSSSSLTEEEPPSTKREKKEVTKKRVESEKSKSEKKKKKEEEEEASARTKGRRRIRTEETSSRPVDRESGPVRRETRLAAKKKAAEERRSTRARKDEVLKVGEEPSGSLKKNGNRRR